MFVEPRNSMEAVQLNFLVLSQPPQGAPGSCMSVFSAIAGGAVTSDTSIH